MEEQPQVREEDEPVESPVPPDAPVETPEADPRTEGAPDPGPGGNGPRPADPTSPSATEEQIQEAFE